MSRQLDKQKEKIKTNRRVVDKRNKSLKKISITSTVLFIVVILAFNIIFDQLLGDKLKWDWTTGDQYSIGDVSKQILSEMDKEVEIVGLFNENTTQQYQRIMPMLEMYANQSAGKIKVRYVDPDRFPNIMKDVDPTGNLKPEANEFVVMCSDTSKAKRVGYYDIFDIGYDASYNTVLNGVTAEQSFTGAINYVVSETTPVVYFTTGHGEADFQSEFTIIASLLQNNNFEVKTLDLFGLNAIPEDCSVMIMLAPEQDISEDTSRVIATYLQRGGSLMFIADYSPRSFPEMNKLLVDYNIEIGDTRLREGDTDHRYQDDPYIIRAIAPVSTVTEKEVDGFTLADNARGMNVLANVKDWIRVEPVLTTSDQGFAETAGDPEQSSEAGRKQIVLLSENSGYINQADTKQSAKVMLVGSTSLFSDKILSTYGSQLYNVGLFYYSVQFLSNTSEEASLYIPPKEPVSYTVSKGSASTNVFVAVLVTLIIPGLLLLTALVVYRKRKHL